MDVDEAADSLDRGRRIRGGARMFEILPKRQLDFSFLGAGGTQIITVRRALRVSAFYYFWAGIRIHNLVIGTGQMRLLAYETLPNGGDPQEFTGTLARITLTMDSTDVAPKLEIFSNQNLGPYLKFVLEVTQGTAGDRLYAELSAVLLAKVR